MSSYASLTAINRYRVVAPEEENEHLLSNLSGYERNAIRDEKKCRIHMIVSDEFSTRKVLYHDDFEQFVGRLEAPHRFSVCLTYELVHKLVFDFDCLGCKNLAPDSANRRCDTGVSAVKFVLKCLEDTVKEILGVSDLGNVMITMGKTHGIHVICNDINVDRCMYRYICDRISGKIDACIDGQRSAGELRLDEGCSSFVLPLGRNHTQCVRYYGIDRLTLCKNPDASDLCPVPTNIYPFYALKFVREADDAGDGTRSCEYYSALKEDEVERLRDGNLKKLKSYFRENDRSYVSNRESFERYKRDLKNAILPWALIKADKCYAMWLSVEHFPSVNEENKKGNDGDESKSRAGMSPLTRREEESDGPGVSKECFSYFDKEIDTRAGRAGFVDGSVVERFKHVKVMAGPFVRLNNAGQKTAARKYVLLEDMSNVRDVIYKNDIIPDRIWKMLLVEYFDSEIGDNKFVIAIMKYITSNDAIFDNREEFSDDQKLHIVSRIIANCSSYDFITGILNDIYGTYKKILSRLSDASLGSADDLVGEGNCDAYDFTFRGKDTGGETKFDEIKSNNYDVFSFCASLIYYHGARIKIDAVRCFLYYYNYINEDTLNKILSEFVDCNTMISLMFQTACARYTGRNTDKIEITTPAEMFKNEFKQIYYETDVDDDDDEDDEDHTDGRKGAGGSLEERVNDSFGLEDEVTAFNRKRKNARDDYGRKKKRSKRKKKVCSRELIKTLKKYFWRPFTLNGIPYMYNGNEYEIASSTYRMVCDALKCTQSTFQDINNAKKFEQRHGRNFLYNTNFYYESIKAPALLNVVLKIRETACGGINSLLHRSYFNTGASMRSDIDTYDLVVDALNALGEMENDINRSSFRFVLTQPVVPLKIEEDAKIKGFLENTEYGFIALNVKDYNRCLDVLEKGQHPSIDALLNQIICLNDNEKCKEKYLKCFSVINSLIQIVLVRVLNRTTALSEENVDVEQIIRALFGKESASQIGWTAFQNRGRDRRVSQRRPNAGGIGTSDAAVNVAGKPQNRGDPVPLFIDSSKGNRFLSGGDDNDDADAANDLPRMRKDEPLSANGIVDLNTRIKWIFNRNKNKLSTVINGANDAAVKNTVYSIAERFAAIFDEQTEVKTSDEDETRCLDNEDKDFEYYSKDDAVHRGVFDKKRKAQMLFKLNALAADAIVRENFLTLVKAFEDEAKIETLCRYARRNVVKLPFRLKLASFLIAVHFFKRLPNWKLSDVPCYKKMTTMFRRGGENSSGGGNDDDIQIIPENMIAMIRDVRFQVIRWLYIVADKCVPFDFFTGFQNEQRDGLLRKYICKQERKYPRARDMLSRQNHRDEQFNSVLLTLTYLYYMCSFDVDTLILILKLILSIEFPGQWLKLCVILCGHRHAGKSKLLDILTEYSKASASFKEPSDSNKENQPGFALYISNMILIQDEIASLSNNFKKIISESKIDFRNNMGNVFASIYALSKLWYTCNTLPKCPYDSAVIDRVLHIMVESWHEEITNGEVAQFRYFSHEDRKRIYDYSRTDAGSICSQLLLTNEGSLPFVFLQKETKILIASTINESAIKSGLYYISMFFSWFYFVKDIHKPVDIDIKNLPSLPDQWRQQWLARNTYFKWKNSVKITVRDGCDTKVSADLILASLKNHAEDYNASVQMINTFNEEFGRYYNKKDNTYTVSIDMNKLL